MKVNYSMMARIGIYIFAAVLLVIGLDSAVLGCSCMGRQPIVKSYSEAAVVFVGTVSKMSHADSRSGFSNLRVSFIVDKPLKRVKTEQVDIFTSSQGTACGFPFEVGNMYLVYGYGDENPGSNTTNICVRTRYLELGRIDDEVEILKTLSAGKLIPRIYGSVVELTRGIYPLRSDSNSRKPMPNIRITAVGNGHKFDAMTDIYGKFRMIDVPAGVYQITVLPPTGMKVGGDYWDETTRSERDYYRNLTVAIGRGESPEGLALELRVDGRIGGKIVDKSGKPVAKGIPVTLVSRLTANKEPGDIDYVNAYTTGGGKFEFFGIPQGQYYVGINIETKPHKELPYPRTYYPLSTDIDNAKIIDLKRSEKLEGLMLILPDVVPTIELKGLVLDKEGHPIKGAIVERYGLYNTEWHEGEDYSMKYIKQPTFEGRVETNERGEFSIPLLKGNKYRINAYKDLLDGDDVNVEVIEGLKPITFVLNKTSKK